MKNDNVLLVNRDNLANKLKRRSEVRRLLSTYRGVDGFSSAAELAEALGVHPQTIREDLRDMGAVRLRERLDGRDVSYWTLPTHNPAADDMREVEQDLVENTFYRKVSDHVTSIARYGNILCLYTERGAGSLLYEWVSLLQWNEIVFIIEQRHALMIHCVNDDAAAKVQERITGRGES
jgi:arginine repressor